MISKLILPEASAKEITEQKIIGYILRLSLWFRTQMCIRDSGMAAVSVKDGLVKLLKKESLTHGIQVEISEDNKITLNFHVIVSYGVSISAVTDNLISNVKYKVEEFTGMTVDKIKIYIEGVRVIDLSLIHIYYDR